ATRPTAIALIWSFLGGHLLLPVGTTFKLDMVPVFDKSSVCSLSAFFACLIFAKKPKSSGRWGLADLLLATLLLGPFITSQLNGDAISVGRGAGAFVIPGVGNYDALSASVSQLIVLLPFVLGRRFLVEPQSISSILKILVIGGLAYSLLMLI